jgi:hypothetical protein
MSPSAASGSCWAISVSIGYAALAIIIDGILNLQQQFRTDILDTDLLSETTTTFYRFNIATSRFETAGEITWIRNRSDCIISFGIHQVSQSLDDRPRRRHLG